MNLCFFSGTIIEEPTFKFIISNNKNFKVCTHISICFFKIKLENSTIITIIAYDEMADFCYHRLKRGDFIAVSGALNDLFEITIDFCQMI